MGIPQEGMIGLYVERGVMGVRKAQLTRMVSEFDINNMSPEDIGHVIDYAKNVNPDEPVTEAFAKKIENKRRHKG